MGKILGLLILSLTVYGVVSCTIKQNEKTTFKENQKTILNELEQELENQIFKLKKQYSAGISWVLKLGYSSKEKIEFRNLYTSEIQDAFLIDKPHLLFGGLEDFKNEIGDMYEISLSDSSSL